MNLDVFLFIPGDLEEGARKYKVGCFKEWGQRDRCSTVKTQLPSVYTGGQGLAPLSGLHRQSTLCAQTQQ